MTKDKSRIQSCIGHINTAIDVDPWAKELVAEMGKEILKAQLSKEDATSDCISRDAAIGIERNATVDTNPSHFEAHQKFTQFMDDAEISSFGRWQWSNGFNTALTAVGIDLKKLPPVQPDIIHCKDCKYWMPYDWMFSEVWQSKNMDDYPEKEIGCQYCDMNMSANDFCSRSERRTDEA